MKKIILSIFFFFLFNNFAFAWECQDKNIQDTVSLIITTKLGLDLDNLVNKGKITKEKAVDVKNNWDFKLSNIKTIDSKTSNKYCTTEVAMYSLNLTTLEMKTSSLSFRYSFVIVEEANEMAGFLIQPILDK